MKAARFGDGGIIGGGSKEQLVEDLRAWEQLITLAHCFIQAKDPEQVKKELSAEISESSFKEKIDFLLHHHFLVPKSLNKFTEEDRYSRNYFHYQSYGANPDQVQECLRKSKVVIIGCGGIGNHTSVVLATAGVGEIMLVDDDLIEKTNLTRQVLFTEDDIGLRKTHVMKRELQRRNSDVHVSELIMNISTPEDLHKIPEGDIWVVSADHPFNLINWVNKHCVAIRQSYINAGYVNDIAVFGPLYIPDVTGCYECQKVVSSMYGSENSKTDKLIKEINSRYKPATFAPVNNVTAAMCANDVLKFLGKYEKPLSLNKRIGIWSDQPFILEQNMERSSLCKICGCRV